MKHSKVFHIFSLVLIFSLLMIAIPATPVLAQETIINGYVGMPVTINGTGFLANQSVTVNYDDKPVTTTPASVTTDADGAFSATFIVPTSVHGEHSIIATDGKNTVTVTFYMESTPPPIPALQEPKTGANTGAGPYFVWQPVGDVSGVTYTLQIASDANFTNIVLEKKGLTESQYTVTREEKLKSTQKDAPYYWRVKAIDGASNESEWSSASSFYVGFTFGMPQWAIYTLFGIVALLLGLFGFWLVRRTAYSSF